MSDVRLAEFLGALPYGCSEFLSEALRSWTVFGKANQTASDRGTVATAVIPIKELEMSQPQDSRKLIRYRDTLCKRICFGFVLRKALVAIRM